jgi:Flp pilus assembly protein TadD
MDVLKIVAGLVLGVSIALVAQTTSASDPPDKELNRLRAAVAAEPNAPESHFRLGDALEKSGDLSGAESEYQKSLTLQAKNPSALGALAYMYSTQKRFSEAEIALRSFIALQPQDPKAHVQLARVLFSSGKNDEAAKELTAALGLASSDPGILMQVAQLYSSHEMYSQAEPQFAALTRILPDNPESHYGHGVVLLQLKNFPAAQAELQRAVSLRPDLKEAYGDLAVAAAENKDFVMAIRALDARARYLPESAGTYFLRATSYDHLKQFPSAADNYKKFLAADAGKNPNQEWQAKHRLVAIEKK